MERWGSSFRLHDVEPGRLIGVLGAFSEGERQGSIRISFAQTPEAFTVERSGGRYELCLKWDIALKLIALLHISLLQTKLLRGEAVELATARRTGLFEVTGGRRSMPLVCAWDAGAAEVSYVSMHDEEGSPHEIVLSEAGAMELGLALAETMASNGARGR
jgi:hypothetical protein